MKAWQVSSITESNLGYFRIYFTNPGEERVDVTFFRNIPTKVVSYSYSDPFSDAVAVLSFPQITIMDSLGDGDLYWLKDFTDIDIVLIKPNGNTVVVWEGFVASYEWSSTEDSSTLTVQAQGALFQIDKYVSYPQYPPNLISYENLIREAFDPELHPHLRTQHLTITYPDDWDVTAVQSPNQVDEYRRPGKPGKNITGYATRVTGAWDKALTGFVAGLLQLMYASEFADMWTIRKKDGRRPELLVKSRSREVDYEITAGQPGVALSLARDYTQYANLIYGSGTDLAGSTFNRQTISRDGSRTNYIPMAYNKGVYPIESAKLNNSMMRVETYVSFDAGMSERDALRTSELMLARNQDPGYVGTLTLSVDPILLSTPDQGFLDGSRYLIQANRSIRIKHFAGSGSEGIVFHIAESSIDVESGVTTLKIDSKFRDLLTLEEVLIRTRDPLTPVRMLQVGKQSILIPDQMAPWDYKAGSGYVPQSSKPFYSLVDRAETFPYEATSLTHPPSKYPDYYIGIPAAAPSRDKRWAGPIPIRMAEKGDIRLIQFACFGRNGKRLRVPFHVSLYYHHVTVDAMPYDGYGHSPFIPRAFQTTNEFGIPIPAGTPGVTTLPDQSLIIGWGDGEQPAGYSPGTKTHGDRITGQLIDETTWSFDCTNNPDFNLNPAAGFRQPKSAITIYAMFYAESTEWIFVRGRFFKKEPGS